MAALVGEAERVLNSRAVAVEPVAGGFTAQRVVRLRLDGGGTAVLKAAPPASVDARLDWPAELGREIALYRTHPHLDVWRPACRGVVQAGAWGGLLMEDLGEARRPPPWDETALTAAARGLAALHAATGRPSHCLVHGDVRSDNLFLVPGRGLVLCDWAEASPGSGEDDAVYWAVGVEREGGSAETAFQHYAVAAGLARSRPSSQALVEALAITADRLGRLGEPAPVRELRQREMAVLGRWLDASTGASGNGDVAQGGARRPAPAARE